MKPFKLSLDWFVRIAACCVAMTVSGQTEPTRQFNEGEFLPYAGVPKEFRVRGIALDSASKEGIAAFRITVGSVDPAGRLRSGIPGPATRLLPGCPAFA